MEFFALSGSNTTSFTSMPAAICSLKRLTNSSDETREFSLLKSGKYDSLNDGEFTWKDNQVLVKPEVTKAQMNAIKDGSVDEPTLTFTAYAVQLYKTNGTEFTAEEAWAKAKRIENNAN